MNNRPQSRKFFYAAVAAAIIFLTGCATKGYHTPTQSSGPLVGGTGEAFAWPLEGRVVLPYAAKEEGVSLKGAVMEARENAPVTAARSGKVVLVDEKLRGYGRTVLIEHDGGFATVYARLAEILVRPGQTVTRGQPIGKVGSAGKDHRPSLYFEIRQNSKAQDPSVYLPGRRF